MMILKKAAMAAVMLILAVSLLPAQGLTIASGAGYKTLVDELCGSFQEESGIKVDKIYGNMGQVTSQAKISGLVDFVIGDKDFFTTAGLPFDNEYLIGRGKLVLAFSKGNGPVSLERLSSGGSVRIAQPDPSRAIYGKAAPSILKIQGWMRS